MPKQQRRILICGDRNWKDYAAIYNCLCELQLVDQDTPLVVIEGEASGADSLAAQAAREQSMQVLAFPADWTAYGRAAGPIKNKQMLDEGKPTEVHAFHDSISTSKGTLNMLKQARKRGIRCYLHAHVMSVTEVV
jgi:hypothetical protein